VPGVAGAVFLHYGGLGQRFDSIMSENSYSSFAQVRAQYPGNSVSAHVPGIVRWHLAAARGEIKRAAAVTAATWTRARRAVVELLYDK